MTSGAVESGAARPKSLRRIVIATSAGTIFEGYDFILFGSLAPLISRHFFAGVNDTAAFIFSLMTFAAGFAIRPLGALVFGSMGDLVGRKRAFLITISLMGLATFAIGLLPTYATAGIWAPILLIALRLIQGLAFGGEYGGAVVYTAEHTPHGKRGLIVGLIQTAGGFALFSSFMVIYITRSLMGEDVFQDWGWRVPFLISIALLVFSIWIRLSLDESPLFQKMQAEGKASKRPLREAFGTWSNLKVVLRVLFGLMMLQGVLFYTGYFYSQFFLVQILKMPSNEVSLIMMVVTLISVPLYVLFSWATDRVGRKPVILTGAILSVITLFPLFHALTATVNPSLAEAERTAPVTVVADPDNCSVQFDPVGEASFLSSCDIAKSTLARLGISYNNAAAPAGALATIKVGTAVVPSLEGTKLTGQALSAARSAFEARLTGALKAAGYPAGKTPTNVNVFLVGGIVLLMIVFAVMVYSPMSVMALESFPTRVRYSSLSLPYHIGSGWFGGFLPAIAFAMVAANGNIYFGLWYPVVLAVIAILVLAFTLPETKDRDLQKI